MVVEIALYYQFMKTGFRFTQALLGHSKRKRWLSYVVLIAVFVWRITSHTREYLIAFQKEIGCIAFRSLLPIMHELDQFHPLILSSFMLVIIRILAKS